MNKKRLRKLIDEHYKIEQELIYPQKRIHTYTFLLLLLIIAILLYVVIWEFMTPREIIKETKIIYNNETHYIESHTHIPDWTCYKLISQDGEVTEHCDYERLKNG